MERDDFIDKIATLAQEAYEHDETFAALVLEGLVDSMRARDERDLSILVGAHKNIRLARRQQQQQQQREGVHA